MKHLLKWGLLNEKYKQYGGFAGFGDPSDEIVIHGLLNGTSHAEMDDFHSSHHYKINDDKNSSQKS